jgi:hypothetical protein
MATKTAFADFIKSNFGTARQAALALGVSPATLYAQKKNPRGGYKVLAEVWTKYKEAMMDAMYYKDAYQDLAERYNDLASKMNEENGVAEYLNG